nr:hypothetical protein [Tanacetum cinerariifolium]
MSDSNESGVTYTDISSLFEELSDIGSPRADDHEHLMLPKMLEDPYVEVALQAPLSPDYIPGPEEPEQAPPSPDYIPGPEHADDEIVAEDQPYDEDASPIAQSPEYVPESDFEAHPEDDDDKDPEEDPVDYPADGGDDGNNEEESSEDDEDDEMDIEADEEEEEEHPAPADSVVVAPTTADQAPSAEETEPFETDDMPRTQYSAASQFGGVTHTTGNISYFSDFEKLNGGYVAFGGNLKGGKITGKGKIKTGKLDFDDVYFVKELKFNLFSVSQMCDKKNSVLFTDTKCLVLSYDFKLPDKSQMLLRVPRENNMYNVNLRNIVPSRDLTCLFTKASLDESNLWHRRMGHVNFKTINKLVKGNFVRGLPTKVFTNDNSCVACKKGKQHRASCKSKTIFLASKDETPPVLKTFIIGLENFLSLKVKVIRCDNGTEFKIFDLNQFCELKGIKREFSVPRTPQQNDIAERKNRTLIEAARTLPTDSVLPIPF